VARTPTRSSARDVAITTGADDRPVDPPVIELREFGE
jgi:hypothetical protein